MVIEKYAIVVFFPAGSQPSNVVVPTIWNRVLPNSVTRSGDASRHITFKHRLEDSNLVVRISLSGDYLILYPHDSTDTI